MPLIPCTRIPPTGSGWGVAGGAASSPTSVVESMRPSPLVLLCPEDRNDPSMYESTSYAYSLSFYHSPDQINAVTDRSQTVGDKVPECLKTSVEAEIRLGGGAVSTRSSSANGRAIMLASRRRMAGGTGRGAATSSSRWARNLLKAEQINAARDGLPDANVTINGIKGSDVAP